MNFPRNNYRICMTAMLAALLAIFCASGCRTPEEHFERIDHGSFFDLTGGRISDATPSRTETVRPDPASHYIKVKGVDLPEYRFQEIERTMEEGSPPLSFDAENKVARMFNFSDAPFHQVVSLFARELGFQYLLGEEIRGKTTLFCEMELTDLEVWDIFRQIMINAGVFYTMENGLLMLRPMAETGQAGTLAGDRTNLGVEVFRLKHLDAKNMAGQLAPFITKGVKVIELPSQNAIMLMDAREVIDKVRLIVEHLDQPARRDWYKGVFPCRNVPPLRIAEELGQLLPVLGIPVAVNDGKDTTECMQIVSLDRLELLIISSPTAEALDEARQWIERLDNSDTGDQEQVYIYKIMNSKAEYLTEVLSVIFALEGVSMVPDSKTTENSVGGVVTTTKDISSRVKTSGSTGTGAATPAGSNAPKSEDGNLFDAQVRIFADGVNNSLVIRTKPRTFTMIKAILDRLDVLPKQVLIQVMVVEVGLTDSTKFGVEFSMTDSKGNIGELWGTNYKNLNPGSADEFGGKFWLFNPNNPSEKFGYIQALSGMTDVKVLSSPQVLVISHSQAKIAVGNMVPLVNSEITNSQSVTQAADVSTNLVRNIQYQDTGIILKIIPQATASGQITLIMDQTVSEAVRNTTSNIDSPEIQSRTMQTTMMIRDGQTVLCGGMIKEKITDNLDSIPLIDTIPFLRRLVGDTDYQKQRTEMLILVTGSIIEQDTPLEQLVNDFKQSVELLEEFHRHKTIFKMDPERSSARDVESILFP